MRILLPSLLFAAALVAQEASPTPAAADPLLAARARLAAALQKCAAAADTAFLAQWGPDGKPKADDALPFLPGGAGIRGEVTGSWHRDRLHMKFAGDVGDELVLAGRRLIAKDSGSDWCRRAARFADGNELGFLPDVPVLLEILASFDLPVVQRTTGALDDHPMEILSLTLASEQVSALVWADALPASLLSPMSGGLAIRMGGMPAAGKRAPAVAPEGIVDLAIWLDPATGLVHRLQFRSWVKQDGRFANVRIVRAGAAGGAVQVLNGGAANDDEQAEEAEPAADAPLVYDNGLPKRPRKKVTVTDYSVRLQQHGKSPAPELSDRQKQLLGH